ncbi:MAG: tail fiber domain-containing protein [Planctomycetota bacterium]
MNMTIGRRNWVVKLVAWSGLVWGAWVRPTRADEVLTLSGALPRIGFIDNVAPNANWQITASGNGFDVRNVTNGQTGVVPFLISADSPNNALRVTKDSNGDPNVGIGGVAANLKQLHIRSLAGPQIRMERTVAGSPRTWDILGGLHFSIKEVEVPGVAFQINPGAPDNSLSITSTGIGMGIQTPDANSRLDIRSGLLNGLLMKRATADAHFLRVENSAAAIQCGVLGNGDAQFGSLTAGKGLNLLAGGTAKMTVNSSGQISIGDPLPAVGTDAVASSTGAVLTAGGVWKNSSSRARKRDIHAITAVQARDTMLALQPVGFRYLSEPEEHYLGFIAEDVPALVATQDRKSLAPMDIVAVLTKFAQDQDHELASERQKNALQEQRIIELSERLLKLEQKLGDRDVIQAAK